MDNREAKLIASSLDAAAHAFDQEVYKIARRLRTAMLPYFRRNRLTFKAGNGTWSIERETEKLTHDCIVEDDALPKRIRDALYLGVGQSHVLGFYVDDITPADWSTK